MNFKFKKEKSFEERKAEFNRVTSEYPKKVPIICEKASNSRINNLDKTKYLVDEGLSLPQFTASIKKKLELDENEALFLLANGKVTLPQNETIGTIYKKYKDKDGFLYIAYAAEENWG